VEFSEPFVPVPAQFAGTSRFQIVRLIGQGGGGMVYEALDREQNARVALKTLRVVDPQALLRFKQEFRALQDLEHPNLVRLGELVEEAGVWFFTMELVQGLDLLTFVRLQWSEASDPATAATQATPTPQTRATFVTPADVTPDAETKLVSPPSAPPPARLPGPGDHRTGETMSPAAPPQPSPPPRPGPRVFSEPRLRHTFAQLAEGLEALHRARLVHRDVKPSNVLVGADGRVVILDFGLTTEVADDSDAGVVGIGTLAFMAPEQYLGAVPQPASDWYAVGVALYLALTGALPFGGRTRQELAARKLDADPPSPRRYCADLPPDLEELCLALLRREPAERPTGAEVIRRLGETPVHARPGPSSGRTSLFLGRAGELGTLAQAFADSRRGATVGVLVTGDSGIGKSALVRRFRDTTLAEHPDTVVLAGRCHERESVPYKAVDGIVDALSRHLRRLPDGEVVPLLPRWIAALGQVFPVLRQVDAIARLEPPEPLVERTGVHQRVFGALRELLERVGERWPLVVLIDDLQWADTDSLALLAEVVRPPGPRLLLVATQRGPAASAVSLGELEPRRIHVGALSTSEAQELAARCLDRAGAGGSEAAEVLAREAAGHPLFIAELAQHVADGEEDAATTRELGAAPLRLDDVLRQRIARLEDATRRVLELVAIAGIPLAQGFLAGVAGLPFADFARHVATLRSGRLLRTTGPRAADRAEPYHDRISESLRAGLAAEVARDWHGRLARALEPLPTSSPELLSTHWVGAGEPRRAAGHAVRAAEEASKALAFARSARLYRQAIELFESSGDRSHTHALEVALAGALVNAGRSRDAAAVYERAAARAGEAEALDLYRRAGEAYLVSGQVDEGMATMTALLERVGLRLPRSRAGTLLSFALSRAQLKLRGLASRLVEEADVAPELLLAMDIAWAAGMGLGFVNTLQSAWFQQRFLLLTLRTGERRRLIRGLLCEAVLVAAGGSRTRAQTAALLARLKRLGADIDRPYERGWIALADSMCAYLEGRYARMLECAEGAIPELERAGFSSSWELDTMRLMLVTSQFMTGRTRAMVERCEEFARAARDRGDHYEGTLLRTGIPCYAWLIRGDARTARLMASEAVAGWSKRGTIVHSVLDLAAQAGIDLYEDPDGDAAWRRARERQPAIRRAFVLNYQMGRVDNLDLCGRARVAAARRAPPAQARALLRGADKIVAALEREGMPPAAPLAAVIRAAALHQRGERDGAVRSLRAAAAGFDAASMALHAQAARRRLGVLLGDDEGRALVVDADAWMSAGAVADPARLTGMLAPGFGPAVRAAR
jgi:serine/threonine protein kinase/tetratricopeptide (TPR) repeat protein